jgi:hypothetical protein
MVAARSGRPRLETLLDVVFRVHGQAVLDDLLSDLAAAQPNALHGFFAQHLIHGGRHITADFTPASNEPRLWVIG